MLYAEKPGSDMQANIVVATGDIPHRHAQGLAQEGALHLLPLHAQSGEGCVAPVALKVCDEVLDDGRRDDVSYVLCILMLHAQTVLSQA